MMMVLLYKKISKYLLFRFSLFGLGLIVFGLLVANAIKQMPPKEALAVVGQLNMTTTNTVQTIVNTTTLQTTSLKIGATEVIDASRNLKNIGAGSFSGNVGIGITNPGYKLDVTSPAGWQAKFGPNATTYVGISENQISGFGGLFYINSTSTQNVSMVNGGGNVGIGTVSPVQKLDIAAPPNEGLQLAGTSPTITFKDADNRTGYWHFNSDIMYLLSGANGAGTAGWSQVGGVWPLQINTATNATTFGGTVTAPTFVGALSGNATTATTANAVSFNSGLTTGSGPTFADVYVNGWFRNNASLQGLYNQANGNHFYSETATRWTVTGNGSGYGGLKFRDNHQSTVKGNIYYDGSGFGMLNNADNWMFYTPYNTQTVVFPGTIQGNLSGNATSATNQSGGTVNATTAMIAGGSSSNWASLNIGGSNSINAGGSIYSYDAICVGNSSGHCDSTGGVTLGRAVGNAYITTGGTAYFGGNVTGPIFYDANNAGYYLNPDGTSNLYAVSNYTRAAFNLSRVYTNRRDITADQSYWTGTNGWSAESTWDNAWKYGFGGLDMWGTNTGHPQGAGYIHAQGIMSGEHAAATDGSTGYGWMMVGAHAATENRYWLRGKWGGSTSGWVEMITTGNIASQSVSYANSAGSATNVSGGTISMNDNKIWFRSINDDNHYLRFENLGTGHDSNGVRFHEYGGFRLSTLSASSALEILTNGNVGIGTASPAQKLHVNGSVIIDPTSAAGYTEGIRINTAPNGYSAIFYGGAATSVSGTAAGQWWGGRNGGTNSFQFVENGVPMMTILPTSGSVGIGTTGPTANLQVTSGNSASATSQRLEYFSSSYTDRASQLVLYKSNSNTIGTNAQTTDGTMLGSLSFNGYSGNNEGGAALIAVYQEGATGAVRVPGRMEFHTGTNAAAPSVRMVISNQGNVGIGTTSPGVALDVVGNARFSAIGSGTYVGAVNRTADGTLTTATSDIRLKTDITTINNALDKVKALRGITFNWKDPSNPKRMMGMIAQEVMDVVPELVFQNPTDGFYGINYGETAGLLIEAMKEQQAQIETIHTLASGLIIDQAALRAGQIEGLDMITTRLALLETKVSSVEAQLNGFTSSGGASTTSAQIALNQFDNNIVSTSSGLTLLGKTTVYSLSVIDKLTFGLLTVESDASASGSIQTAVVPLRLQKDSMGNLEIMGSKIIIDTLGNMIIRESITVRELKTNKLTILDVKDATNGAILGSSAGNSEIAIGETAVKIKTSALTDKSLIFATPENIAVGVAAKRIDETTIELSISTPLSEALRVSWWVIN